jgi:cell division transport system permease protein
VVAGRQMSFFHTIFSQVGRNFAKTWGIQLFTFLSVSLSILIFAFFFLIYVNLARLGETLGGELRLTLYFEDEILPAQQEQLKGKIRAYTEVDEITYVSRENAFARLSRQLGNDVDVLADLDPSFLPTSLEIYPKPNLQNMALIRNFADYLATLPGVEKVQYGQKWLERFSSFTQLIRIIVLISGTLLVLTNIFMISHTIRLTLVARGEEIEILRLLGADRSYIQGPLLVEGFLQGLLGSTFGVFLLYLLYGWTRARFGSSDFLGAFEITFFTSSLLAVIIFAATLLCMIGSLLSTRKFLRL